MDCGIATSKTILLFLSLVFWAAGAALAYVGAFLIKSYNNFEDFLQHRDALVLAVVIIGISVLMFVFGLVGCCSTARESTFGLSFFFLIIAIIFVAEVAALVLNFVFQDRLTKDLGNTMNGVFNKYGGDQETHAVDFLQKELQCCGVNNYTSWTNTTWFSSHNRTVPLSCCKNSTATCTGSLDQLNLLNLEGCEGKLGQLLHNVLTYAMLVILGFAVIKFFGMVSVCVITCRTGNRRGGYQPLYG